MPVRPACQWRPPKALLSKSTSAHIIDNPEKERADSGVMLTWIALRRQMDDVTL
jgi:hypothetical protein